MRPLSTSFIRAAVIYSLIAMSIGIMMVTIDDHAQMPTHAHMMLIGFVMMFLFGLFYRAWPQAEAGWLPVIHFIVANLSLIGMAIGFWIIYEGDPDTGEMFTAPSTSIMIFNQALFGWIAFRGTRA